MPSRKKHTNPFLLLIAIAICLVLGVTLRQSNADFSVLSEKPSQSVASVSDSQEQNEPDSDQKSVSPSETATPSPTEKPSSSERKISDGAASGVWTSSGSEWVDADGKRYYMDLDGIMQTGVVTVDGKSYELLDDGSLKGYKAKTKKATTTPIAKAKASKSKNKSSEKTADKYVALTFDDGPSSFTNRLLDCLEANNSKATFFMVGKEIDSFPDEVKRMESLGCELGNHTYSHVDLTTLAPEDMSAEIAGVDEDLVNLVGHGATVLRPPYGNINDSVRSTVGTPMILWSIDTLDWETQDASQITEAVMSQVQDGSIILMHDIFSTSVDAAEIFIPKLIEEGYQLVTIHELAKIKGTELTTGIAYGDFTGQ